MAKRMGYDGLELACWGDHFDVDQAASSKKYCKEKWQLLTDHGLSCHAISNHLTGQAICDLIDERTSPSCPPMFGAMASLKAFAAGLRRK